MSRELNLLSKEFSKTPVTVMRAEVNLYQSNIQSEASAFLRKVEQACKKQKQSKITLIAVMNEKSGN